MNSYDTDQEQIQLIKTWWRKYGRCILLAVLVFLATSYSFRYYATYKERRAELASLTYTQMLSLASLGKEDAVLALGDNLMKNYKNSSYASLAALTLAKHHILHGQLNSAADKFRWIIKYGKHGSAWRQIARLRLARLLLTEKAPQAMETLATVDVKDFLSLIWELRGDIFLSMGKKEAAVAAYQSAFKEMQNHRISSPLLLMKIQQL